MLIFLVFNIEDWVSLVIHLIGILVYFTRIWELPIAEHSFCKVYGSYLSIS